MYRDTTVGVVVPAYNEAGFVGEVLREIPDYVDRIYVVNDCSTDETRSEIHETIAEISAGDSSEAEAVPVGNPISDGGREFVETSDASATRTQLFEERTSEYTRRDTFVAIDHTQNFGAGGAVKTGYLAALIDGVEVVATIDADGQMDPTILDRLLDPVVDGTAGYAKGTRLIDSDYREEMPPVRQFGNTALTYMTKVASGYWELTDSQNGYTAISRDVLSTIDIENLFEYYAYCNSVLVKLNVHNVTVADVEVPTTYGEEESDIEVRTFVHKVTPMLCRNFVGRLRRSEQSTIRALYGLGGVGLLVGLALTAALGVSASERNDPRYAVISAVVGGLSIAVALLLERSLSSDLVTVIRSDPASVSTNGVDPE